MGYLSTHVPTAREGVVILSTFAVIDLIAIATMALNGALLALNPRHYQGYTVVGIVILGTIAGLGGGVLRDVLLNQVPATLTNPLYLPVAAGASVVALLIHRNATRQTRYTALQFFTAFSLPWYAVAGAAKGLDSGVDVFAAVLLGVIDATTGSTIVEMVSRVTPRLFGRGEGFVVVAFATSILYVVLAQLRLPIGIATLIVVPFGFALRVVSVLRRWELPEPRE